MPMRTAAIGWADRAWFSRTWRLGMAAAAIGLVAADVWVASGDGPTRAIVRDDTERRTLEELVRSAGLPEDMAASVARRSLAPARASALDRDSLITGGDR